MMTRAQIIQILEGSLNVIEDHETEDNAQLHQVLNLLIAGLKALEGGEVPPLFEKNKEFSELELQAMIAPSQSQWPTDYVHWQRLGAAASEARERLGKFYEQIDEIEADPRLTPIGKAQERKQAAERALAAFTGSSTLARAQESVAVAMKKWEAKISSLIKPAANEPESVLHGEIRRHVASLKDDRERRSFLEKHAGDPILAAALLEAPQFLSGLSDVELAMVKAKIEAHTLPPEVAEAKFAATKAMREVETGWERAQTKIAAGGGLNDSRPQ